MPSHSRQRHRRSSEQQRCSIFSRFPHASLRGVTVSPSTAMSQSLEVALSGDESRESRANSVTLSLLFLDPKMQKLREKGETATLVPPPSVSVGGWIVWPRRRERNLRRRAAW